jgi:hypothetical protein
MLRDSCSPLAASAPPGDADVPATTEEPVPAPASSLASLLASPHDTAARAITIVTVDAAPIRANRERVDRDPVVHPRVRTGPVTFLHIPSLRVRTPPSTYSVVA